MWSYSLVYLIAVNGTAVSLMLGVATTSRSVRGNGRASYPATARFRAANDAGNRLPCLTGPAGRPDPAVFAAAVTRYRALERLREFRSRLYACLARRADALFELTDAVLCADHAVTSLVQLCLEPEFTRGHGALYDALSAGRIDDERLFSLLAAELPPAVDGPEAPAWIAEHDVIDRGTAGEGAGRAGPRTTPRRCGTRAPGGAGCGSPSTRPPTPGRTRGAPRAGSTSTTAPATARAPAKTAPGWEYQFTAAIGHLRTAWAALVDVARTTPATRTAQTIAQVKNVLRRLRAAGHGRKAAPLFVFDAGYSAAALADGLLGCPAHILVRLAAGSVFYAEPVTWDGKYGRPPAAAPRCTAWSPRTSPPPPGSGPRGRKKPLPPNPEPDEELALPDTPLYGTVRAEAWHGVHPLIHGDRGWFAGRKHLPVLRGTLVHVTVERLPDGRDPHRAMWLWHAGPGPLSLDELWRAYLARFDIEHAFKLAQGHPRPHRREGPRPRAGRPLGPDPHGRPRPAPARPPAGRRPPPPLGETARSRPAADTGPGPPRVSQHPP